MDEKRLKSIRLFLFDMDGTIYLGNRLFDFTRDLLNEIKRQNKKYLFITNNSSKSVSSYVKKLAGMGIDACNDDFVTSSQATVHYLKSNGFSDKTLYVFGTESLKNEIEEAGFKTTADTERAECIVMGFDTELTFRKLDETCRMLSTRDIPYIATHPDLVCPTEYGSVPDCGSVIRMIETATGKTPVTIGKPKPLMIELAMKKENVPPRQTAVVGDRLYTDIQSGINARVNTILVLSGETTREVLNSSDINPDFVFESGKEILEILRSDE